MSVRQYRHRWFVGKLLVNGCHNKTGPINRNPPARIIIRTVTSEIRNVGLDRHENSQIHDFRSTVVCQNHHITTHLTPQTIVLAGGPTHVVVAEWKLDTACVGRTDFSSLSSSPSCSSSSLPSHVMSSSSCLRFVWPTRIRQGAHGLAVARTRRPTVWCHSNSPQLKTRYDAEARKRPFLSCFSFLANDNDHNFSRCGLCLSDRDRPWQCLLSTERCLTEESSMKREVAAQQ